MFTVSEMNKIFHNQFSASIRPLSGVGKLDSQRFGQKAYNLARAAADGFEVPNGFAIDHEVCQLISEGMGVGEADISQSITSLLGHTFGQNFQHKLIVRSSCSEEGSNGTSFSGLFKSIDSVESTEQVIAAIKDIVTDANRRFASESLRHFGCSSATNNIAVIVQESIDPLYSGVIWVAEDFARIESIAGHLKGLVSGLDEPFVYVLNKGHAVRFSGDSVDTKLLSHQQSKQMSELPIGSLRSHFGECVVEFAVTKRGFLLLQLGDYTPKNTGYKLKGQLITRKNEDTISKTQAMKLFIENNLFTVPAIILDADLKINQLEAEIAIFWSFDKPITVRLSNGNAIGLPRGFFTTLDAAMKFIAKHKRMGSELIVHQFLDATNSFELLVERDSCYMEHVPGLWESDNRNPPDVFRINNLGCSVHAFRHTRPSHLGTTETKETFTSQPLSLMEIREFCSLACELSERVRSLQGLEMPINVHAIWDRNTNSFQCLNIRPTTSIHKLDRSIETCHIVSCIGDLVDWDRINPVRLTKTVNRGSENQFVELAKALAKEEAVVVVEFGLLSHPAMVLRDYGCFVIGPEFLIEKNKDQQYRTLEIQLDEGYDPYERILCEKPICSDNHFHIVWDRNPVTSFHLLAMNKIKTPSVLDGGHIENVWSLFKEHDVKQPFYFERGRASFCTSGFTASQGHFHIVGLLDNVRTFENLRKDQSVQVYFDLVEAYQKVPLIGEYCVFGSAVTGFAVVQSPRLGKQFFRRAVVKL